MNEQKKPLPPLESREEARKRSAEFSRLYVEGLEIGHKLRTGQMTEEEFRKMNPHALEVP
jgi:hypothetical protein